MTNILETFHSKEIDSLKSVGASGFVIGALDNDNKSSKNNCSKNIHPMCFLTPFLLGLFLSILAQNHI